jgi:hypothetical protein
MQYTEEKCIHLNKNICVFTKFSDFSFHMQRFLQENGSSV